MRSFTRGRGWCPRRGASRPLARLTQHLNRCGPPPLANDLLGLEHLRGHVNTTSGLWRASPARSPAKAAKAGSCGRRGDQPGLPAVEGTGLSLSRNQVKQVDAGVRARDVVGLAQVGGLLLPADAEERVRRLGLVAVLGDPDRLAAVEAG